MGMSGKRGKGRLVRGVVAGPDLGNSNDTLHYSSESQFSHLFLVFHRLVFQSFYSPHPGKSSTKAEDEQFPSHLPAVLHPRYHIAVNQHVKSELVGKSSHVAS